MLKLTKRARNNVPIDQLIAVGVLPLFRIFSPKFDSQTRSVVLDISSDNLEIYAKKILNTLSNYSKNKKHLDEILALGCDCLPENVEMLHDYMMKNMFNIEKLSDKHAEFFRQALTEMLETSVGTQLARGLLLLMALGDVPHSAFTKFRGKGHVVIMEAGEHNACLICNDNGINERYTIMTPLNNDRCITAQILVHELLHLYNSMILSNLFGYDGASLEKALAKNIAKAALDDLFLTNYLFPSHSQKNFDALVGSIESLTCFSSIKLTDNLLRLLDIFHKSLKLTARIPLERLLKDWNIDDLQNGDQRVVAHKIATIITAGIISSKNYWDNYEEMLAISGIIPMVINGRRILIMNRQNENAFLYGYGLFRFSHLIPPIFSNKPSKFLHDVISEIQASYDELYNVISSEFFNRTNSYLANTRPATFLLEKNTSFCNIRFELNDILSDIHLFYAIMSQQDVSAGVIAEERSAKGIVIAPEFTAIIAIAIQKKMNFLMIKHLYSQKQVMCAS